RRRHTRFSRDWSSDVCSSDLHELQGCVIGKGGPQLARSDGSAFIVGTGRGPRLLAGIIGRRAGTSLRAGARDGGGSLARRRGRRSEERRVGKECRARWWPYAS